MTSLTKNAAELYFVLGVLITSLLADNETTTYLFEEVSLQVDVETSTPIPSVTVLAGVSVDNESTTHNMTDVQHNSEQDSNTISDLDHTAVATEPVRHSFGRGLPHFHLPDSRWGPFFEEGAEPHNITARVGSTVMLDCRIGLLQDKTVTWLHHKEDSIHLLTVGRSAYSSDERITLSFRYPNNFRLQIIYVTRRDEGLYECQVATHPPKVKRIFLKVTAPEVQIADESGRQVTERYYKAGSGLELTCIAKQLDGSNEDHPIIWKQGDRTITKGISSNISAKGDSASSTLTVAPLQKRHSGNYTCAVGTLEFATVAVHVLNGELPAAVHHGNAAPPGSSGMHLLLSMACVTAVCLR